MELIAFSSCYCSSEFVLFVLLPVLPKAKSFTYYTALVAKAAVPCCSLQLSWRQTLV